MCVYICSTCMCKCANVYSMYVYVYMHMSMYPSPVDVVDGGVGLNRRDTGPHTHTYILYDVCVL